VWHRKKVQKVDFFANAIHQETLSPTDNGAIGQVQNLDWSKA
jgi:hypothetical protein